MPLKLADFETVYEGLSHLRDRAYSVRQNLDARKHSPNVTGTPGLWAVFLDSRTMQLCGGRNEDAKCQFKIDHDFDVNHVVNSPVNRDGSVAINEEVYDASGGTEFAIITNPDLIGVEFAIRADKYSNIRDQLGHGQFTDEDIQAAGGFKINESLTPQEAVTCDGWLELAVGRNKASIQDYAQTGEFLTEYISIAEKEACFPDGKGMGLYVWTDVADYQIRPWFITYSSYRSYADSRCSFFNFGRFLRTT